MVEIVVLHYPEVRQRNWELFEEAARRRNVRLLTWEPHRVQICCADEGIGGLYDGKHVHPGVVLHRTVAAFQGIVIPALELWASEGSVVLNSPQAACRSRDKLLTSIALQGARIPVVRTVAFAEPSVGALDLVGDVERFLMKPAHGVGGEGIQLLRSPGEAIVAWETALKMSFPMVREHYLAQPLVNGGGRDMRGFVVGGFCIALIERYARDGEFRANLALGGVPRRLPLDHPAAEVATAALAACELDYGGVDLIEDENGVIRVLEVDAWAGFAGITAATGRDVAGAILDLVGRVD